MNKPDIVLIIVLLVKKYSIIFQSEDLLLLKQEIDQGLNDLEAMLSLRKECIQKSENSKGFL